MAEHTLLHYTQCGLDNVFLLDGYTIKQGRRGQSVVIEEIEDLHAAIGETLVRQKSGLTGSELRFLRHEMGLSQAYLGQMLGESEQSVARREKRLKGTKQIGNQERMIRYLYEQFAGGDEQIKDFLLALAEQDDHKREDWKFENKNGWNRAA